MNLTESPKPVAELWRSTLHRVPTVFGRLAYVAGLRDAVTGRYSHPALDNVASPEDMDRTLRHSHDQVFAQWLAFRLAEQKSDLDEFLNGLDGPRRLSDYRRLIPPGAREVERQLYLTDLETLLELLDLEPGGASRTPGA
jgi:hypothetical protein